MFRPSLSFRRNTTQATNLSIRMWVFFMFFVSVKVSGVVSGDGDEVKRVTEGDIVLLHTGSSGLDSDAEVTWLFKRDGLTTRIAQMSYGKVSTLYEGRLTDRLRLDEESGSLTISNISTRDSGVYEASLTIRLGVIKKNFRVDVYARVSEPVIGRSTSSGTSEQSSEEMCVIFCSVRNDRDVLLSWYKADVLLNQSSSPEISVSLSLALELHSADPETYNCTATNPVSQKSVRIHTQEICPPQEVSDVVSDERVEVKRVTKGDVLLLHTGSSGLDSDAEVTWLFKRDGLTTRIAQMSHGNVSTLYEGRLTDRLRLDEESGSLTIFNISPRDSGVYEVSLTIRLGVTKKNFRVDVYAPVSEPVIERSTSSGTSNQTAASEVCVIICSVRNDRDVSLSWCKGDVRLNQSSSPEISVSLSLALELHSADPETYSCTAANPVSEKSVRIHTHQICSPQEVCEGHCGVTEALIRLFLSVLVGIATVFFVIDHVKICSSQRRSDSSVC